MSFLEESVSDLYIAERKRGCKVAAGSGTSGTSCGGGLLEASREERPSVIKDYVKVNCEEKEQGT